MPTYKDRLREAVKSAGNCLCVGIDPDLEGAQGFFARELASLGAEAFLERFGMTVVEAVAGKAPAVKPQSAYFEAAGAPGVAALGRVIAAAKRRGLTVILDAKRGDIASTMRAYGRAAFEVMGADALTVTPYMGFDVLEPLLPWLRKDRGVYLVWVSSNASGAAVQDPIKERLFADYRRYVRDAGAEGGCGLVLGATRTTGLSPETFAALSDEALLVPGVGAQGGEITPAFRKTLTAGAHSLVNVSRGIANTTDGLATWDEFGSEVARKSVMYGRDLKLA